MARRLVPMLAVLLALTVGCGASDGSAPPGESAAKPAPTAEEGSETSDAAPAPADAEEVLLALKDAGLPVGDYVVYTEETDGNDLLGRPGQYTSKVNFRDNRLEPVGDFDTEGGGSVEMFDDADDAQDRYEYVDSITRGSGVFAEYHWLNETAFLRLGKALTPSQAEEYKAAFDTLDLG